MIESAAIEQRKEQLQGQFDQVVANANALRGAIQECDFWIALLEKQNAVSVQSAAQGDGNCGAQPIRVVFPEQGASGDEPQATS